MNQNFNCPIFGHSTNLVGKNSIVILGGALGTPSQYKIQDSNYIFNIPKKKWIQGTNLPSARVAHASFSFNCNHIVVFGGIQETNKLANNELLMYIIDMDLWQNVPIEGEKPQNRYGHTLSYNNPNLILFGGNNGHEQLNDTWILNTTIEKLQWFKLNLDFKPNPRMYHTSNICPSGPSRGMMIVFGGRSDNILNEIWGLIKHRNNQWQWIQSPIDLTQIQSRQQHQSVFIDQFLFVIGGRSQSNVDMTIDVYDTESSKWISLNSKINILRHDIIYHEGIIYVFGGFDYKNQIQDAISFFLIEQLIQENQGIILQLDLNQKYLKKRSTTSEQFQTPVKQQNKDFNDIRLANQAEVAFDFKNAFPTIKKIHINSLQEESRKIGFQEIIQNPMSQLQIQIIKYMHQIFYDKQFLKQEKQFITMVCQEVIQILQEQPTLLQLRTPIKIFGNLHGNLQELIRIFENFSYPNDKGDIERMNYLFLGDYVDRGSNSIELILLLFSLKIKYPKQIYLLRGNHEDSIINKNYGFAQECEQKYGEDVSNDNSIFQIINKVFEYLPLAAILDDKYFCVHAGIGNNSLVLNQIQEIKRPIRQIVHNQINQQIQLIQDLLWSDLNYTNEQNLVLNQIREIPGQKYKFNVQNVQDFLKQNNLQAIIRSHECCQLGFENFNNIVYTVFSVQNYCNIHNNQSSILLIKKNGEIIPKQLQIEQQNDVWINVRKASPIRQ